MCNSAVCVLLHHALEEGIALQAAVMLFILPAPFVLQAFSKEASEAGFISSTLSLQTIITIIGFAVMAALA